MPEFGEHAWIHSLWYVELPVGGPTPKGGNWSAWLWRPEAVGAFKLEYRFRYYEDDLIGGNSEDRKSRVTATVPPEHVAQAFKALDMAAEVVAEVSGSAVERVDVHGDVSVFFKKCEGKRWFQVVPTGKGGSA